MKLSFQFNLFAYCSTSVLLFILYLKNVTFTVQYKPFVLKFSLDNIKCIQGVWFEKPLRAATQNTSEGEKIGRI